MSDDGLMPESAATATFLASTATAEQLSSLQILLPAPEAVAVAPEMSSQQPAPSVGYTPMVDHTSLPTELWLEIFRYATYVPRSRDLTVIDPFSPERLPNFAWGVNNPVLSLRTKCTLVRVSKAWKAIATELLYEHIVVASMHRGNLIIRTLQESVARAKANEALLSEQSIEDGKGKHTEDPSLRSSKYGVPAYGHGQWIRHLEIRSCTRNTCRLIFLKLVAAILSYCTNLHVLNGVWTEPVPKEFLQVIERYHGKTLRGLGWEQTDKAFKFAVKNIQVDATNSSNTGTAEAILSPKFLPLFQQLRILDLRTLPKNAIMAQYHHEIVIENAEDSDIAVPLLTNDLPTTFMVPAAIMCLPHVTTLRLPTTPALLAYASKISLPALHDILLDASHVAPYSYASPTFPAAHHVTTLTTSLLLFLTVHGSSLTSLELVPSISTSYKPSPYPLSPGFFLQPGVCPNLERLVFDCRERSMVLPVSLESVRSLRKKGSDDDPVHKPATTSISSPFVVTSTERPDLAYLLTSLTSTDLLTHPHPALRLIAIRGLGISRLYPNKPTHTQNHLLALLSARMSGYLPFLEVVRTAGFLVDTSTDGLARDIFIWWTERFELCDVDLVDGEGVLWLYEEEKGKGKGKEKEKVSEQGADEKDEDKETSEKKDGNDEEKDGNEDGGSSKLHDGGDPIEIYYVPTDSPIYVHKNDPTERAAKNAGTQIALHGSEAD